MLDSTNTSLLPDQSLSDSEAEKQYGSLRNWYLQSARFWGMSYNKLPVSSINKISVGASGGEVQQILENFTYFQGVQRNTEFAYLSDLYESDGTTSEAATPFLAGQDIATIIQFQQGQFLGIASSAEPRVDVINPEMKNKAIEKIKMVEVARVFKDQMAKITEDTGFEFKPPANPQAGTEEVVKTIYRSFASDLMKDAGNILEYVKRHNLALQDYVRAITNVLVGRRTNLYVKEDGIIEEIPPYQYFSAASKDDDFGKYDVARGYVVYTHKDEIIAKYSDKGLLPEDINSIRNGGFYGTELFTNIQGNSAYPLYNNQTQFCSEVTVFWKATIDTRYRVVETEEDGKKVYKLKSGSKKKGVPAQVIKRATIIAGMFVCDYGIHDVISDPTQMGNKLFPICTFQPNTYLGFNQSLVDRLKNKQKELDAINQRVRENYTTDLGTIISINGKKFRDGITPVEIYSQLRKTRFFVATETGEDDDITNNQPMMQREDVSLMRDIENYLQIKMSFQNDIKEIANVSAMIMGTPTSYIGLKTQQNSASLAANSVQYQYSGVMQLFADAAAIALENTKREIQKNPDAMKWQNLLGEDGVDRVVALKDEPYTKFLLSISTREIIDPAMKDRLLAMSEQLAATGQIDPLDWMKIVTAKTTTELVEYFKWSVAKKREMERMNNIFAQASANQQTETMAQGQMAAKQAEQMGGLQKQNTINNTKLAQEMLKQGYSQADVAAFMQGAAGGGQPQQGEMPQQQQEQLPNEQAMMQM